MAKSIHEQPLVSPVGEQRYIADVLDAQRPQKRLKDQTHEVTTYKVPSDIETVEEHEERVEKIKEEIKREEEKKKQPTIRERTNYENAQQALGLDLEGLSVYANEEERQKHIAATKKIIEDFEAGIPLCQQQKNGVRYGRNAVNGQYRRNTEHFSGFNCQTG